MLSNIWEYVTRLFGIQRKPGQRQSKHNDQFANGYEDITKINITAMFAARLAALTVSDSSVNVTGENRRAEWLKEAADDIWTDNKKITARLLGTGGVVLVPYIVNNRLYYNIIGQERMLIINAQGRDITEAVIVADMTMVGQEAYYRLVHYTLQDNGVLTVTNKVSDKNGRDTSVHPWGELRDIALSGVARMPFAYIKSPVDNRRTHGEYGVPVTYGCDPIIAEISECFTQIADEYRLKQVRIFADNRLFSRQPDGRNDITEKLFCQVTSPNNGNPLMDTYSPDIRDISQYNRLKNLFALLEKAVGTSAGILTENVTRAATATEIKASLYDTYAMIDSIRKALERGLYDYLAACDILANYHSLTPPGEWSVSFDWSYALIENSQETFDQYMRAQSAGILSKAELRQWLRPSESIEEAQTRIDEISAAEPTLKALLGTD